MVLLPNFTCPPFAFTTTLGSILNHNSRQSFGWNSRDFEAGVTVESPVGFSQTFTIRRFCHSNLSFAQRRSEPRNFLEELPSKKSNNLINSASRIWEDERKKAIIRRMQALSYWVNALIGEKKKKKERNSLTRGNSNSTSLTRSVRDSNNVIFRTAW